MKTKISGPCGQIQWIRSPAAESATYIFQQAPWIMVMNATEWEAHMQFTFSKALWKIVFDLLLEVSQKKLLTAASVRDQHLRDSI